jgi:RHS repeat-associated protein
MECGVVLGTLRSSGLAFVVVSLALDSAVHAQVRQAAANIQPTAIERTVPQHNAIAVHPRRPSFVFFDAPLRGATVPPASVVVTSSRTTITTRLELSPNGRLLTIHYPRFLPEESPIQVLINGDLLIDRRGLKVDADGDGRFGGQRILRFATSPATARPENAKSATITGYVFDTNGRPMPGALIKAYYFPRHEGADPLPVPTAVSDAAGFFRYDTHEFLGTETLLVEITKPKWSELLRQVDVIAGGCLRVVDGQLQPLAPEKTVDVRVRNVLKDQTGTVELDIPAGALSKRNNQNTIKISVTMLASSRALRDQLPSLVSEGTFVDVHGVFGEKTSKPVKMRFPNKYGLPAGTEVPFGKIDHNTLQWSDLRDLSPAGTVGRVDPTGKFIEVQFDRFCSICTGYCLPYKTPEGKGGTGNGDAGKSSGKGPGTSCGNSIINLREGYLEEVIRLPGMREFNQQFALALGYASYSANPSVTLSMQARYGSTRPVERTVFQFHVEGVVGTAAYSKSQNNQKPIGTFFWDGRDVLGKLRATGSYPYKVVITSLNSRVPVSIPKRFGGPVLRSFGGKFYPGQPGLNRLVPLRSKPIQGRTTLINLQNSPFGAGWRVLNEERIHRDEDDCIVLVLGNSDWRRYVPDAKVKNRWTSPAGDVSTLVYDLAIDEYVRSFPNGRKHFYSAQGRILRKVNRYGHETTFAYSGAQLSRVTSPTGYWYQFSYDSGGKVTAISDSANRITRFSVNAAGNLASVTDVLGTKRQLIYDGNHRLTAQVGGRGERSEYTYTNGRVTAAAAKDTAARGGKQLRRRTFAPSALNGELGHAWKRLRQGTVLYPIPIVLDRFDRMVDGRGARLLRQTNDKGQTILAEDGLKRRSVFAFNKDGRLSAMTRPNRSVTRYEWDAMGNVTALRQYDTRNQLYATTSLEYTGPFGLLSKVVDAEGKQTTFGYDRFGNLTSIVDHDGNVSKLEYLDARFIHLPTRLENPGNVAVSFAYDRHGNLSSSTDFPDPTGNPRGRTTRVSYDGVGNLLSLTDPKGSSLLLGWDAWGRVRHRIDPFKNRTTFDYSEANCSCSTPNLTTVTFANQATIKFVYDGLDRLVDRIDQRGKKTIAAYGPEGSLLTLINRNGPTEQIKFEYDLGGQMVRKILPRGSVTLYHYDGVGSLLSAADPGCRLKFEHDFLGRVTAAVTVLDLETGTNRPVPFRHRIEYSYDRLGNRRRQTDDFGVLSQSFVYDNGHRIKTVSLPNLAGSKWEFAYDKAGRRTSLTAQPANLATTYQYDRSGQLSRMRHNTSPLITLAYRSYDEGGSLLSLIRNAGSQTTSSLYSYDAMSRLASAGFSKPIGDRRVSLNYSYDAAGRLGSDGEFNYTYDTEGRLLRRSKRGSALREDFAYDAESRLTGYVQWEDNQGRKDLVVTSYAYDPLGRRVSRTVNGVQTQFLYDFEDVLHELDSRGRAERSYVMSGRIDDKIGLYDWVDASLRQVHVDRLGTIVATSDGSRKLVVRNEVDEYGQLLSLSQRSLLRPLYTGRGMDYESGLYYYRNRTYSSETGQFLTEDPLDLVGGLNLRAYVGSNPVNGIDPLGLQPTFWDFFWRGVYDDLSALGSGIGELAVFDPRYYNEVGKVMETKWIIGNPWVSTPLDVSNIGYIPKGIGYSNKQFMQGGRIAYRWANQYGTGYKYYTASQAGLGSAAISILGAGMSGYALGETIDSYYYGYVQYRRRYR